MKTRLSLVVAAAVITLALSPVGHAQQKLSNQDIVKMVKAGLAEDVIVTMIGSQPTQFAVTPDDIIALKKDGVSDKVIAAMLSPSHPTAASETIQPSANTAAAPFSSPSTEKPNDAQILSAIRSDPNRNNPRSLTALVLSTTPVGSGARINDIDVSISGFRLIRWGEFNSAGKYWPVELCVNGVGDNKVIAKLQTPTERIANGIPQAEQFQTRAQYRLHKDDFGQLKAEQILVSEWKPLDSICPRPPSESTGIGATRSAFGTRTPGGPETLAMLTDASKGDQDSSAFRIRSKDISATLDVVWSKVTEQLTKDKDKIVVSDKNSGLVVTALTHHGFAPNYFKYCIVFDKITEETTRVTLKLLSYFDTNTKIGRAPIFRPNDATFVNRAADKFLDGLMK